MKASSLLGGKNRVIGPGDPGSLAAALGFFMVHAGDLCLFPTTLGKSLGLEGDNESCMNG